jgi:hypothetical protein
LCRTKKIDRCSIPAFLFEAVFRVRRDPFLGEPKSVRAESKPSHENFLSCKILAGGMLAVYYTF